MRGRIDETALLVGLAEGISSRLVIDLEAVEFINSMGLREWISFLRALRTRHVEVVLRRCSMAMVTQMNVVVAARGTRVESFFAPYVCQSCLREQPVCLDVRSEWADLRRRAPRPVSCGECGGQMQYEGLADHDLQFLDG